MSRKSCQKSSGSACGGGRAGKARTAGLVATTGLPPTPTETGTGTPLALQQPAMATVNRRTL
eukprot:515663-Alexandrium_andersonii.AAC.1